MGTHRPGRLGNRTHPRTMASIRRALIAQPPPRPSHTLCCCEARLRGVPGVSQWIPAAEHPSVETHVVTGHPVDGEQLLGCRTAPTALNAGNLPDRGRHGVLVGAQVTCQAVFDDLRRRAVRVRQHGRSVASASAITKPNGSGQLIGFSRAIAPRNNSTRSAGDRSPGTSSSGPEQRPHATPVVGAFPGLTQSWSR